MQRRKFIKDALTGLPIIVLSPSVLSSSCKKNNSLNANDKTVIVVGAGISGLAAAKKLKTKMKIVPVKTIQDALDYLEK